MTNPRPPLKSVPELLAIMAALRAPATGCPWDQAQTVHTIAPYTIEEAYEVADAIERGSMADLRDELGDLLFQVVYHSRLAEEQGCFAFPDVVDAIARKMLRRHPHVFGTKEERAAGVEPGFWERVKSEERAGKLREVPGPEAADPATDVQRRRDVLVASVEGNDETGPLAFTSLLDGVPVALPALTRAIKLQDKAAKVGFDWPGLAPVMAKLREELAELDEAVAQADGTKIAEEFGDLMFVVANVARHLRIDPEASLRGANAKFIRRFRHIEARLNADARSPEQSTLEEMDRLWDEAKVVERAGKA